jgi:hypothetical protein
VIYAFWFFLSGLPKEQYEKLIGAARFVPSSVWKKNITDLGFLLTALSKDLTHQSGSAAMFAPVCSGILKMLNLACLH